MRIDLSGKEPQLQTDVARVTLLRSLGGVMFKALAHESLSVRQEADNLIIRTSCQFIFLCNQAIPAFDGGYYDGLMVDILHPSNIYGISGEVQICDNAHSCRLVQRANIPLSHYPDTNVANVIRLA